MYKIMTLAKELQYYITYFSIFFQKYVLDACATMECYNGGTCNIEEGTPKCSCHNGYNGTHCDKSR